MAASVQRWVNGLFRDEHIAEQFSDAAQFASFARFEQALVAGLEAAALIDAPAASALIGQIADFQPDGMEIAAASIRDGVPVPEYIRQMRLHVTGPGSQMLHHTATSQDLVDTATIEALAQVRAIVAERLEILLTRIADISLRDAENSLQAVTRMQPALAFRAADRLAAWRQPLLDLQGQLPALRERTDRLQFGGAVGNLQALGANAGIVAKTMAQILGLDWPGHGWHSARGPVVAFAGWLSELTGALGKIGQDVALMALRGDQDIRLSGGGSSSAMPHKQNPVTAERLVAMARLNATLMSGIHQAQIHEMERSGAAWTLEWMLLPQICETAGASLNAAYMLFQSIDRIGEPT